MLNKLAKNQYVKLVKDNGKKKEVEYGIVLNENDNQYDIMSVGFENKDGHFLEYPPNVENLVQTYGTNQGTTFDEVKENEVRRAINVWVEKNYKL
ncbi:MAG: hypothetical protein ACRCXA_13060 [Peptostreptococcaceae bacterium]